MREEQNERGKVRYRVSYTRASEMDDGKPCRVYCEQDHPDADEAIVEITGIQYQDWRFGKVEIGGEMRWDYQMDRLLRAFQVAFDQGVAYQRVKIRDTLREVIGL